ncbi:MAG: MFS transporter [Endomicrobium sp.]|nr:MFS transporter [Endomicrobium sp.]
MHIFFFTFVWCPVMWIMIDELFSLKARELGAGVSSVAIFL